MAREADRESRVRPGIQLRISSSVESRMISPYARIRSPCNGGVSNFRSPRCRSPDIKINDAFPTSGAIGFGVGCDQVDGRTNNVAGALGMPGEQDRRETGKPHLERVAVAVAPPPQVAIGIRLRR